MAIMATGRIVASVRPAVLTADIAGKIWAKTVNKEDVAVYRNNHDVISTRLYAGQTVLHVYDENDPGNGFAGIEAGLEDVYFHKLSEVKTATETPTEA